MNKGLQTKYKNQNWYIRVINREDSACFKTDIQKLINIVKEFSNTTSFPHVKLICEPTCHPRGGYSLQFDCKKEDRPEIANFLHNNGFLGVF